MTEALTVKETGQLQEYEAVIRSGLDTFYEVGKALLKIRDARLYRAEFGTFEDYCRERWGMSRRHVNRLIEASVVVDNLGPVGPKDAADNLGPIGVKAEPITLTPKGVKDSADDLSPIGDKDESEVWRDAVKASAQNAARNSRTSNFLPVETNPAPFILPTSERHARELGRLEPQRQRAAWSEVVETAPAGKITAAHVRAVVDQMTDGQKEEARAVAQELATRKAQENAQQRAQVRAQAVPLPPDKYSVIVIDPPWPMEKIQRDVRPNQVGFDYPTMTEAELDALPLGSLAATDCHLFVWATQKFLPQALRHVESWGFRYVCLFVWRKSGGPQPYGLPQYNCEFVVYARRGTPVFVDTKAFNCCFDGPRREHSRKPDEFFETVARVADGARLEMFARTSREGWTSYGNETGKFKEVANG